MKRGRRLRRLRRRARKRGVALIMVLASLTILTMMLAEFQADTSATLASAMADRDGVQAEYDARSAVNLSRLLIAMEPTIRQGIAPLFAFMGQGRQPPQLPVWEFADRILAPFNDSASNKDFASSLGVDFGSGKHLGLPAGRFEVDIVDEDAKIDVNLGASNDIAHIRLAKELMGLMGPPQFDPLFQKSDENGNYNNRLTMCAAIIDWADVDETAMNCDTASQTAPTSAGVEDAYYQLLPKNPYRRKNAPYDSLEELHMVRGVTEDFWSTFVDPDPTKPEKRVMTVWGQGAVNVNSANAQTLLGVVCSGAPTADICTNPVQAGIFLTGVTMARGMTMGAPLFGSTGDFIGMMEGKGPLGKIFTGMGMTPVQFLSEADFAKTITTESKVFSIYAVGVIKGYKRETRLRITTVVDFRNAAPLGQGALPMPGNVGGLPTQPPPQQVPPQGAAGNTPIVVPATAGNVLYFRID
jgi:general secretion pathway protein K